MQFCHFGLYQRCIPYIFLLFFSISSENLASIGLQNAKYSNFITKCSDFFPNSLAAFTEMPSEFWQLLPSMALVSCLTHSGLDAHVGRALPDRIGEGILAIIKTFFIAVL